MEKLQSPLTDSKQLLEKDLDYDWVILIQEALVMGITIDEIKQFLQSYKGVNPKNH